MLTLSNGRQTLRRVAIIPIVEQLETDSPRVPRELRSALQRHLGSATSGHCLLPAIGLLATNLGGAPYRRRTRNSYLRWRALVDRTDGKPQ